MRAPPVLACAALVLLAPTLAQARCHEHPFAHAGASARALLVPERLAWIGGVAAVPLLMVPSGMDHTARVAVQRDLGGRYDLEVVTLVAPYALIAASASAVLLAHLAQDCEGARVGSALLQSTLVAAGISATLKFALGRGYPSGGGDPYGADRLDDAERASRFRGPRDFGAWPSGHTAVAFAFASALRSTLPRGPLWRYSGYLLATGVGLGMIWGDHHWTSDVISGALLGEAIGGAIGTGFRGQERGWSFVPTPGGAAVVGTF